MARGTLGLLGGVILSVLAAPGTQVCAQTQPGATDPTADDPCAEVVTFEAPGSEPGTVSHAIVVVPHEYGLNTAATTQPAQQKRYPVVYLLHGYGANYANWYVRSREAARPLVTYADRYGLILVCVDGKPASWYLDAPPDSEDPADWQVETTITKHLIPEVDRRYRTWAEPRGRGVVGLSMGGHGAIFLTARHPELFSACGCMSGAIDLTHVINKQNLVRRLGPLEKNRERWVELSAIAQAEKFVGRRVGVLLDCGASDPFFEDHRLLHEKLTQLQVRHEYIARPGAHEWPYWINALPYHLQFVSDRLRPAGLPRTGRAFPTFESVVLDDDHKELRDLDVADMNGDGRLDVVAAAAKGAWWYENPSRRRHTVTPPSIGKVLSVAAEDIDRDGRPDLAVACQGDKSQVDLNWLRSRPDEPWQVLPVSSAPDLAHIRWADIDGDGRRELLVVQAASPPRVSDTRLMEMHTPTKAESQEWKTDEISRNLPGCRAILPLRFVASPAEQFLAAGSEGIHVFNRDPASGEWIIRQLGSGNQEYKFNRGTIEVVMGRLREGQRFLAAIEPSSTAAGEVVVYLEPPYSDKLWQRLVVDGTSGWPQGVACADLDGDGDDEIIAGFARGGGLAVDIGVKAYHVAADSFTRWEGRWIENGKIAVTALRVADFNADRRPDIVAAGDATHNLRLFLSQP